MTARPSLSMKQRGVLDAFESLLLAIGAPPSVRQLADYLEINVSAAHRALIRLVRDGYLARQRPPGRGFMMAKARSHKRGKR